MPAVFKARIRKFLDLGESVQIVGVSGMGKSRFGQSLGGVYLDVNNLPEPSALALLRLIAFHVGVKWLNLDTAALSLAISARIKGRKTIVVIDSLDKILVESYRPLFSFLKALRDQNKYRLTYVFLTTSPLSSRWQSLLGDLYPLVAEHIEPLPPLDPDEYDLFGWSPTVAQMKKITRLSGGIPALVKICAQLLRDHLEPDPQSHPRLKAQLEQMTTELAGTPPPATFMASQIFKQYWTTHTPTELSASETRLLDVLKHHQGQIVPKDHICQAVYPDVKNYAGVSDHAIDQLIHRLRAKIRDKYTLVTHRGRGYQLV